MKVKQYIGNIWDYLKKQPKLNLYFSWDTAK